MHGPKSDYFGVPMQFLNDPDQTTDEDLAQGAAAWAAALDSPFTVDEDWGWRSVETYGIHLDEEALEERNRKIDKGLAQFAKHFQSIWW